jgi:hypothetical protein
MSACSTEEYLQKMRSPKFKGRNEQNTDLVVTRNPIWVHTAAQHTLAFIKGATQRQTQAEMTKAHNGIETKYSAYLHQQGYRVDPRSGYNAFITSGFFGNQANREVTK